MTRLVLTYITKLYRVFPVVSRQKCVVCDHTRRMRWMWKFHRLRKGFVEPGVKHACLSCTSKNPVEARKRLDELFRSRRY